MNKDLKAKLKNLPSKPGVYIFKDKSGGFVYIGKAVNLNHRVRSYFQSNKNLEPDKRIMIPKITDIATIVVGNEVEALLLEQTLIKEHRPEHNIRFRDDKSYQYIRIDYADDFPKIHTTREVREDGSEYFGPFTDGYALKQTVKLLNKLFPFRDCNDEIHADNFRKSRERPCLRYHLKKCLAPCIGAVDKETYNTAIRNCELFLQGKQTKILRNLKDQMRLASDEKRFEDAAVLRNHIQSIEYIITKQRVISPQMLNQDIVSLAWNKHLIAINLFIVREGKLIGKENFLLEGRSKKEAVSSFIKNYYKLRKDLPKEIILPILPDDKVVILKWLAKKGSTKFLLPKRGKKKQLQILGETNAQKYLDDHVRKEGASRAKSSEALLKLSKAINVKDLSRIECYDISNISGQYATGSMAVFTKGESDKSQYRRFKIKEFTTPDDPGMMKEMIGRRFRKKKEAIWPHPNLIILDGGKGQLGVIRKELDALDVNIPLIALAKKNEEIFVPGKARPVVLPRESPALYLIERIRDEAHRAAIGYHRQLRSKIVSSTLDDIPGIGPKTKKKLLQEFGSVRAIKKTPESTLVKIVGKKTAKNLKLNL